MEKPQANVTSAAPGHDEKEEGAGGSVILFFILGLVGSLLVGWILFPQLLYSKKRQPVDFNHVKHMELVSDGCESCHFFRRMALTPACPNWLSAFNATRSPTARTRRKSSSWRNT
jgi:hypothetical protein